MPAMKWLLCSSVVLALSCHLNLLVEGKLGHLKKRPGDGTSISMDKSRIREMLEDRFRGKRATPTDSSHMPIIHGSYPFTNDDNNFAAIHYSGSSSPVIIVLTYSLTNDIPTSSKLYRSTNYGANFTSILDQLDSSNHSPLLWNDFFVSPSDKNLVIIPDAIQSKFYYSSDEGSRWAVRNFFPSTINPRSLLWNPTNDRMALAHASNLDQLYVTQNLGETWTKISENVRPGDYQWGDPAYDTDHTMVYYNTYNPLDEDRGDVSLRTQRAPFTVNSQREFDPNLGRHDDFLLLGPYIFVQQTDSAGVISLFISHERKPFKRCLIPATDPHQNYLVAHINEQQALVIVQHLSSQFNLYLSDLTGVFFTLSLPDIVFESNFGIDLEVIAGVNGTLMANQHVPGSASGFVRTLISLDNGGNWELVQGPPSADCLRPRCSLHFNMTDLYARTGIYSLPSAPGIILAHGNTGTTLDPGNHDLFISRDGGVNWFLTLQDSWGVTVADHGGLLVAARDFRQTPSMELKYSCDEGLSWGSFNFTNENMVIFGVLTEPGEHTTTISLYGVKAGRGTWEVVTVNFSSIFLRTCSENDYYSWHPWDERAAENCILGSSVAIERRRISTCCLIGENYSRPTSFTVCLCYDEDFECDFGFMRAQGLSGECVRDPSVPTLAPAIDSCGDGVASYTESSGYRKVAGDVCSGGIEDSLGPVTVPCEASSTDKDSSVPIGLIVVGVLLAIAVIFAFVFAIIAAKLYCNLKQYRGSVSVGGIHYTRTPEEEPLTLSSNDHDDDDDDPLLT